MLVLFTDFGWQGPYVGLMKLALARHAPGTAVLDLMHDAPGFDPRASAYLLAAYAVEFPHGSVFVGVVDPGVGSGREGMILQADGRYYVGPDNGLFHPVAVRADSAQAWRITWRGPRLSASFHGRDLFAPVAAQLAAGAPPQALGETMALPPQDWPEDLSRIIYNDRYGNALTGIRAAMLGSDAGLAVDGKTLPRARTFSDVAPGEAFWYENSSGLAEIAVNQGSAAQRLSLTLGTPVSVTGTVFSRIAAE